MVHNEQLANHVMRRLMRESNQTDLTFIHTYVCGRNVRLTMTGCWLFTRINFQIFCLICIDCGIIFS